MPLARMMARSETFQERANSSPGLQAFLEKKGDEHAFSCLYLIAGVVCLYAAFTHGEGFCTAIAAADTAQPAPTLAATAGAGTSAGQRRLLDAPARATSKAAMAEMKGAMLDEEPAEGEEAAAEDGEDSEPASDTADDSAAEADGEPARGAAADAAPGDDAGTDDSPSVTFLGPRGWVVTWLTVEGFTALGLPLVSITLLLLRLHENSCVSCVLYLVAVFQALWLIVGCIWAFGGLVPEACRNGEMGDNFAYDTMWWVCAIWLGSMLTISMVICCILVCLMGFTAPGVRPDSNKYEQVKSGQNV